MKKLIASALIAVALGGFGAVGMGSAHADMCGPAPYPVLSYMHPWIKSCEFYLPGAGALPQIPVVPSAPNAPYPIYVPPWGSWLRP